MLCLVEDYLSHWDCINLIFSSIFSWSGGVGKSGDIKRCRKSYYKVSC